jgi:hypothetical protein
MGIFSKITVLFTILLSILIMVEVFFAIIGLSDWRTVLMEFIIFIGVFGVSLFTSIKSSHDEMIT